MSARSVWVQSKSWPWWAQALAVLACLAAFGWTLNAVGLGEGQRTSAPRAPLVAITDPTSTTREAIRGSSETSLAPEPAPTSETPPTTDATESTSPPTTASEPAAPEPAPTATVPPTTTGASRADPLAGLVVASPNTASPYRRAAFGPDWIDADGDCHNTRAEVLMSESLEPVTFNANRCTVATGKWVDPWSGFTSTNASDLQIDHHVPLADAWRSGAWAWTDQRRQAFAQNLDEPDELNAISSAANDAKSDRAPDQWRPPDRSSWCRYATAWARIKREWSLTVTTAELDALRGMVATCPQQ